MSIFNIVDIIGDTSDSATLDTYETKKFNMKIRTHNGITCNGKATITTSSRMRDVCPFHPETFRQPISRQR